MHPTGQDQPALRQPALQNRRRQSPQRPPVKLLIADQNIRVIDTDGELIRELTLDPIRNYQPLTHH
jgi:hypothetical protein